jgi:SAM-dependent methyltransferase
MRRSSPVAAAICLVLAVSTARVADAQTFPEEPPYIATDMELVDAMLRLGRVGPADILYDLGSGDGRIVIEAARRFGTRGVGYEHQEPLVLLSRARAEATGVADRVRFVADDLFRADVSEATVVMLYLGSAFNLRLRPVLLSTLAPGSRVVSNTFHMGDWRPDSSVMIGTGADRATLHLWNVPARVDGFWTFAIEGERSGYALEFDQRFQDVSGSARDGRRRHAVRGGLLRGDTIRFRIDRPGRPALLEGIVRGDRMDGVAEIDGSTRRWIALRFTHPGLAPHP